jgi:hypothetical protein
VRQADIRPAVMYRLQDSSLSTAIITIGAGQIRLSAKSKNPFSSSLLLAAVLAQINRGQDKQSQASS